jgi:site-specific DNA recombinase
MSSSAAIYARLSKDDRRKTSIPRQLDMCQQAAAQHGYEVLHTFTDDGYSGALLERPGLERLMALVRSGQIQAVFEAYDDRLAREPAHAWLIRQELKQWHVALYVGGQPLDDSPEGEMKDDMLALFAKWERVKIRQRMLDGKKRRAGWLKPPGSGRPMGGQMPLGYIYLPDPEGRIVKDPEAGGLVLVASAKRSGSMDVISLRGAGTHVITIMLSRARRCVRHHVPSA